MSISLSLHALPGFPLVEPGDDLGALILGALDRAQLQLQDGDVLALAQKIVSKAENRYAYLNTIQPSPAARELAAKADKDPRIAELILRESTEVVRVRKGAVIVRHRNGYVHANAGIDQSNISAADDNPRVLLLPENPDRSAQQLRDAIQKSAGVDVCVIINDSAGRPWRNGVTGFAIGTAGFVPLVSKIGAPDLYGRPLEITEIAVADELAAAASFAMGQAAEGTPVVLIRGARLERGMQRAEQGSQSLIRPLEQDLFR
jgi:coenzyme F420-0:L-glutamate ligase/coenzyme F420-1:gamma-L-glutamate ligase